MTCIAYLANLFPASVEPYVIDEIQELRRRGITVLPCSARKPKSGLSPDLLRWREQTLYLQTLSLEDIVRATRLFVARYSDLLPLFERMACRGRETLFQRFKALSHVWLGVVYAGLLCDRGVDHIHVHHGYFSAWIALVAARLLGITWSMTLHGSDLLVGAPFLDVKLKHCNTCYTVSQYNLDYICRHFPELSARKLVLRRLGVDVCAPPDRSSEPKKRNGDVFTLLSVGRLHPVKDYTFLIWACVELKRQAMNVVCLIAGEGPERRRLQSMITHLGLKNDVRLLGAVPHNEIERLYQRADLVVLTSRSEGIPLSLMEAMAQGVIVLAPAITGISELVIAGRTGFLYRPGSIDDFVSKVEFVSRAGSALELIREAARRHIAANFNKDVNVKHFTDALLSRPDCRSAA
ncbi:MAG TPA: glycosyltransferase family 4 protein [Terriglobales bacterium]|nr:glycosyltransferase family 4 protein [Terriglobales bacterium]